MNTEQMLLSRSQSKCELCGNENMGKADIITVVHGKVRKCMSHDNFIKAFNKKVPASPKVALPIIAFNDNVTFHPKQSRDTSHSPRQFQKELACASLPEKL